MSGAYIWGWDYDAEDWVKCRVDDAGKLIIGSGTIEVEQDTPADLQATVTPASGAEFLNYPRIPTGGTQIAADVEANAVTTEIHIVDGSKILYIDVVILSVANGAGAAAEATIIVTNAGNTLQYTIYHWYLVATQRTVDSISFPTPLSLAPGWKIWVSSSIAGCVSHGFIHGYEL